MDYVGRFIYIGRYTGYFFGLGRATKVPRQPRAPYVSASNNILRALLVEGGQRVTARGDLLYCSYIRRPQERSWSDSWLA